MLPVTALVTVLITDTVLLTTFGTYAFCAGHRAAVGPKHSPRAHLRSVDLFNIIFKSPGPSAKEKHEYSIEEAVICVESVAWRATVDDRDAKNAKSVR